MTDRFTILESPVGPLTVVSRDDALSGVFFPHHAHRPDLEAERADAGPLFTEVAAQLRAYFDGRLRQFTLPLKAEGTEFQKRVWQQLALIPLGETRTYGHIAHAMAMPSASRAVGMANGRNPISVVVPCHRVIGKNGQLTGYAGGLAAKEWLLAHELKVRGSAL